MRAFRKIGCVLLIATLSFPCFAKRRIDLGGKWIDRFRAIISEQPIQAWVEDNNKDLLLEFSTNLGTVEVIVTSSAGEVMYKQSVEAKPSIVISLEEEMKDGDVLSVTDGKNIINGKFDFKSNI